MGIELSGEEYDDLVNHLPVHGEHFNYCDAFQKWLSELIIRNIDSTQLYLIFVLLIIWLPSKYIDMSGSKGGNVFVYVYL